MSAELPDNELTTEPEHPRRANSSRYIGRRGFFKKAAILAIGGAATLGGLAACGEDATDTSFASKPASTAPAATTAARSTTSAATVPAATATVPPAPTATIAPTATPAPAFKPIRIGILGDIRTAGPKPPQIAYKLIESLAKEKVDVVLQVGDLINAEVTASAVRTQWTNLTQAMTALEPAPILATVGNHETNGLKTVLQYFVEAFPQLPQNGPDDFKGMTYSIDIGSVHFVSITSEHPNRFHYLSQPQLTWLDKDLSSTKQPIKIVFSHDPAYPIGPHVGSSLDAYPQDRDLLWRIFIKNKVLAYVCGHEHLYNRTDFSDITQLVVGSSGSAIYGGYGGEFYHYSVLEVVDETTVKGKVVDSLGKTRDTFTLKPPVTP